MDKRRYRINTDQQLFRLCGHQLYNDQKHFGGDMLVTVQKYVPPKTRDQNSYLHVLFRQYGDEVGQSEAQTKEAFKAEYGPKELVSIGKRQVWAQKSVRDYDKQEISMMIEHVTREGAEIGLRFDPYE